MLQSLRNIWDIPDLRKRVLFTLGLLAVYRLGNHIPTPGINAAALIDFFEQNKANWFGLVDMFSGGNLATTSFASTSGRPSNESPRRYSVSTVKPTTSCGLSRVK